MENASKALIMAGGVLISLLVIGLLVFFFNNLSSWQNTKLSSEEVQQATEFNKQYDVYARDVYGSEILSLANKIADYNKREAGNKGYSKIELNIEFSKDLDKDYFTKGTYNSSEIIKKVEDLETDVKNKGNVPVKSSTNTNVSRKVSKLATMRTSDIQNLGFAETDYQSKVNEYNSLKTLLTEVKAKVFKYVEFDYDKNTGRITKMSYTV